jgi:hypothetical protein
MGEGRGRPLDPGAGHRPARGAGLDRFRRVVTHTAAALGVLLVAAGAVLGQVRRGLYDSDTFADHITGSLDDPRVSTYVADQLTVALLRQRPDLVAFRPIILATARGAVSSHAFQSIVRVTARNAHAAVLSQGGRNLLLSIPDVGVVLRGALAKANPALAARIPPRISSAIADLGGTRASRLVVNVWKVGRTLAWAARAGVLVGLALLVIGIAFAPRRAAALRRASLNLALAGVVLLLLVPAGRALVSAAAETELERDAAAGVFDAFTGGLRRLALGLGGVGLFFSAAAQSLVGRAWLPDTARSAWAWLARPPMSIAQHLARGALFLIAGVFLILRPAIALSALATAAGAVLAFAGLQVLFRLVLRSPPDELAAEGAGTEPLGSQRSLLLLAIAGALTAVIAFVTRPREPPITGVGNGCNGDPRLCARRLDQVAFAGTHNAMSAANRPGWMFAAQEDDLTAQLEGGVRAFLIDVHAGVPVSGRIKTELRGEPGVLRELEKAVGKEALEAAARIRTRLVGPPEGPRALYLCHGFCELGAEPFVAWLTELRRFLAANPRQVVILVLEDYVRPQELAAAFAGAGLADLVYRGAPRPPWPRLEEMVSSHQQVVTFLESGTPGVDWMHPAFESIQETPFRFHQPSHFSCRANRGGTAGSLFQINHWIETPPAPKPSNAAVVNGYDFLLARARQCERERSRSPNIIAVDFYRTGDLLRVVRDLNGLDAPAKP